jgi:activator of HSP90 ATPase
MSKTIRQSATFKATPREVYEALMTSRLHSKITGARAVISQRVGGKFTAFDGYCSGVNLELEPGKKIVQTWRASDWPPDQDSRMTIVIKAGKRGTRLSFIHAGVPAAQYESIKQGWIDFYWAPMRRFFSARSAAGPDRSGP